MSTRSHLSIGEVLNLVQEEFPDVTISKIRFLESQGLLDPERTPSGYRKFYDDDIERLRWILRQQRENFLPLKVIKDRLATGELDDPTLSNGARPGEVAEEVELPLAGLPEEPSAAPEDLPASEATGSPEEVVAVVVEEEVAVEEVVVEKPSTRVKSPESGSVNELASMTFSLDELCAATDLTPKQVGELESFGLLGSRKLGATTYYDEDSVVVARLASRFMAHGLEARHLRMYKIAAEREGALIEQLALPLLERRSPDARQQVAELVEDLSSLGGELRAAMLRGAVRDVLG